MQTPVFLTVEEVLSIHEDQIERYGGSFGVRDMGLLDSAVKAPAATFGEEYLHHDIVEMAAAYLFYLVQNHAFVDGNKRTGAAACSVFLLMNGTDLESDEPAFSDMVLAVATGEADKAVIAEFLRTHLVH